MSAELDALTGLPTRRAFYDRLCREFEAGGPVPVLLVDLENVRGLNESYGYATVDKIIVAVASRLTAMTCDGDFVARLGGDEFGLLRKSLARVGVELSMLERKARYAVFTDPIRIDGRELRIGVTINVGLLAEPEDLGGSDHGPGAAGVREPRRPRPQHPSRGASPAG